MRRAIGPAVGVGLALVAAIGPAPDARAQTLGGGPLLGGQRYPRTNLAVGYEVDPTWPLREDDEHQHPEWGEMTGIAIDAQGNTWTFDRGELPVRCYAPDGRLIRSWGRGQFGVPHQVRFDREGNLWLVDAGRHVVEKYTTDGEKLLTIGTPGESGEDSTHFNQPTDVAIAPNGDLFIADGYGNNRIVRFDGDGRFLGTWGKLGSNPGEFSIPHAIAMDSRGRLFVADRNNVRIQIFDTNGRFLDEWRDVVTPWHIWVTERDEVIVCGSSPMRWRKIGVLGLPLGAPPKDQLVMAFDPSGRMLRLWTFPMPTGAETAPGELNWVHALAVDRRGNLFLGDIKGRRAQKFVRLQADLPATQGEFADRPSRDDGVKPAAAIEP